MTYPISVQTTGLAKCHAPDIYISTIGISCTPFDDLCCFKLPLTLNIFGKAIIFGLFETFLLFLQNMFKSGKVLTRCHNSQSYTFRFTTWGGILSIWSGALSFWKCVVCMQASCISDTGNLVCSYWTKPFKWGNGREPTMFLWCTVTNNNRHTVVQECLLRKFKGTWDDLTAAIPKAVR